VLQETIEYVLLSVGVIAALWLCFSIWVRSPLPKATLDARRIDGVFRALILMGKDGSYVSVYDARRRDWLLFTKHDAPDRGWVEVAIGGPALPADSSYCIIRALAALTTVFKVERYPAFGGAALVFGIEGPGVEDAFAMESVVRLIVRCLGHDDATKYRVQFLGPKDYEMIDRLLGGTK
jgi:hypothetical protein